MKDADSCQCSEQKIIEHADSSETMREANNLLLLYCVTTLKFLHKVRMVFSPPAMRTQSFWLLVTELSDKRLEERELTKIKLSCSSYTHLSLLQIPDTASRQKMQNAAAVMKMQQPDWSGNQWRGETIQVWQMWDAAWLRCPRLRCETESKGPRRKWQTEQKYGGKGVRWRKEEWEME